METETQEIKEFKEKISSSPLHGEPYAVGDLVTYINDNGVKFADLTVIGFSDYSYPTSGTIHLNTSSYWFAVKSENLRNQ